MNSFEIYSALCKGEKPVLTEDLKDYFGPLICELSGKSVKAAFKTSDSAVGFKGFEAVGRVIGSGFTVAFFDDGSFLAVNEKETKNTLRFCDLEDGLYCFDQIFGGWRECAPRNAGYYALGAGKGEGMLFKIVK